jgi:hypothetical protein
VTGRTERQLILVGFAVLLLLVVAIVVIAERATRPEAEIQQEERHENATVDSSSPILCGALDGLPAPVLGEVDLLADNARLRARLQVLEERDAIERAYRANLARQGLTTRSEHVRSGR